MELAARKQRLLAVLADGVILIAPLIVGLLEAAPEPLRFLGVVASIILIIVNLVMVAKQGRTLGKRLVGIRIVLKDTLENGGFVTNVLKRGFLSGLPYILLTLIHPVLGGLYIWADILFIFRENRRCVHDLIAGTIVVQ